MFCLSIALDYKMVTAIHLTTLFSMVIINIAFGIFIHIKLRKEDTAFKFWVGQNKRVYKVFRTIIFVFSFKSMRLFYCKFLQRPWFNASIENKYMAVARPLFIATAVNFILQVGPIILMDIYNMMFIPWGYQIMVMSIDNLVLAIITFILEIIEFAHFKHVALDEGEIIMSGHPGKQFLNSR